jgi:hypothetical protein
VLQHGGEPRPLVDRVATFHGVIAIFGDQLVSCSLWSGVILAATRSRYLTDGSRTEASDAPEAAKLNHMWART